MSPDGQVKQWEAPDAAQVQKQAKRETEGKREAQLGDEPSRDDLLKATDNIYQIEEGEICLLTKYNVWVYGILVSKSFQEYGVEVWTFNVRGKNGNIIEWRMYLPGARSSIRKLNT